MLVLGDSGMRTSTGLGGIAIIPAGAGVHGSNKLKIGGKCKRSLGTAYGDNLILEGLPQYFKNTRAEFGKLVKEKDSAMGERNLTRVGDVAATDQAGMADGVMRGAEWTVPEEGYTGRKRICDGIYPGYIQGFFDAHAGKD